MAFQINDQFGIGQNSRKVRAPNPEDGTLDKFAHAHSLIPGQASARNSAYAQFAIRILQSDLVPVSKLIAIYTVAFCHSHHKRYWLTQKELEDQINVPERTIQRSTKELLDREFFIASKPRLGEFGAPENIDKRGKWLVPNLAGIDPEKMRVKSTKNLVGFLGETAKNIEREMNDLEQFKREDLEAEIADNLAGMLNEVSRHIGGFIKEHQDQLPANMADVFANMAGSFARYGGYLGGESLYYSKKLQRNTKIPLNLNLELEESLGKNQNEKAQEICSSKTGNDNIEKIEIYRPENTTILHGQTATNSEPNISPQPTANSALELSTQNHPPVAPLQSGELSLEGGENFFEGYSVTFPLTDPKRLHNVKIKAEKKGITREQLSELVLKHDTWLSMQPPTHYRRGDPYKSLLIWVTNDKSFQQASNHPAQHAGNQLQAPTDPKEDEKVKISIKAPIKNSKGLNVYTGIEAHALIDEFDGLTAQKAREFLQKSENLKEAREAIFIERHEAEHGTPEQMFGDDIDWEFSKAKYSPDKRKIGFYRKSVFSKILETMPKLKNYKDWAGNTGFNPIIRDFEHRDGYKISEHRLWKLWFSDINEPQRLFDELFENYCKELHDKMPAQECESDDRSDRSDMPFWK